MRWHVLRKPDYTSWCHVRHLTQGLHACALMVRYKSADQQYSNVVRTHCESTIMSLKIVVVGAAYATDEAEVTYSTSEAGADCRCKTTFSPTGAGDAWATAGAGATHLVTKQEPRRLLGDALVHGRMRDWFLWKSVTVSSKSGSTGTAGNKRKKRTSVPALAGLCISACKQDFVTRSARLAVSTQGFACTWSNLGAPGLTMCPDFFSYTVHIWRLELHHCH